MLVYIYIASELYVYGRLIHLYFQEKRNKKDMEAQSLGKSTVSGVLAAASANADNVDGKGDKKTKKISWNERVNQIVRNHPEFTGQDAQNAA